MKIKIALSELEAHKAQNILAVWKRPMKTRKGVEQICEKLTEAVVRGGIDYDNRGIVKMKRELGELPEESAGLPWGEWKQFPYWISHKETDYLRLYPSSSNTPAKVKYFLDGKEATKEEIEPLCLASEFPKKEEIPLCFTIKSDSLISLGSIDYGLSSKK